MLSRRPNIRRRWEVLTGIGAILFGLQIKILAVTTQPTTFDGVNSYVDRAPPALELQNVTDPGATNPVRNVDASITTSKPPATQPAEQAKSAEVLVVPLPSYKPTFGWGINLMASYLFPLDKTDTVTPASMVGLMGMYTQNNSWGTGVFSNLHIDRDEYRLKGGIFTGQMNYDFYGTGTSAGERGISIPLHERMIGALIEPLFQVLPHFYIGPRYQYAHITTTADIGDFMPPPSIAPAISEFDTNSSALGLHAEFDTRDNQFYPRHGILFDAGADAHAKVLGDSFDYQLYKVTYDQYFTLTPRQVVAIRGDIQVSGGNVPFYALPSIGRGPDLRGYRPGQFQDKTLLAAQAEYRLEMTDRLGLVAFGGLGEVAHSFSQFDSDQLLPSVGSGLRLTISKINHVNLRLDAAWGREGWQGYLSIGEAF